MNNEECRKTIIKDFENWKVTPERWVEPFELVMERNNECFLGMDFFDNIEKTLDNGLYTCSKEKILNITWFVIIRK